MSKLTCLKIKSERIRNIVHTYKHVPLSDGENHEGFTEKSSFLISEKIAYLHVPPMKMKACEIITRKSLRTFFARVNY